MARFMGGLELFLGDYQVALDFYNKEYDALSSKGNDPRLKGQFPWDITGSIPIGGRRPDVRVLAGVVERELAAAGYNVGMDVSPVIAEAMKLASRAHLLASANIGSDYRACFESTTKAVYALTRAMLRRDPIPAASLEEKAEQTSP